MNTNLHVSFFAPPASALDAMHRQCIQGLQAQGFQVQCCTDVQALHQYIQRCERANMAPVIILAGAVAENCAATMQLRALSVRAGILAIVEPGQEADTIRLLQSGIDNFFVRDASMALLGAMLFRLLSRADAVPAAPGKVWSLQEQAWILLSPEGVRIALTTGERAFLLVLLNQPGLRATHRQLIDAVNTEYALESPPTHQARLGVMVSRLRRKFTEHGLTMPIKSVHNWGYMFTGPV